MMTSSKFTRRRATTKKPSICHPTPPPPPPLPYGWPPSTTELHFVADWGPGGPYHHIDEIVHCTYAAMNTRYQGNKVYGAGEINLYIDLKQVTSTLDLFVNGNHLGSPFSCFRSAVPMIWGVPTNYNVYVWDTVSPADLTARAKFTI